MAVHSSILAWRIPWTEKPGRLQSMGSQRVEHEWVTNTHTHTHWWLSGQESVGQRRRHRFHPWSRRIPHAAEQLSPCATTLEPVLKSLSRNYWAHGLQLLKPSTLEPWASTREITAVRSPHAATKEEPLLAATKEKLKMLGKNATVFL